MKKILFFHHNSRISGAGVSGRNVIRAIDKNKYEVVVYCSTRDGETVADFFSAEGVRVIKGGDSPKFYEHCVGSEHLFFSPRHFKNLLEINADKVKIRRVIQTEKPDIVILNSMTLFWISCIAREFPCKVMMFFRETWVKGFLEFRNRLIESVISQNIDEVVFISRYDCISSRGITCKKTTVYNAIDFLNTKGLNREKIQQKLGIDERSFNLLYVGGASRLKGLHVLLRALPLMDPKVHLNIVGFQWNGRTKALRDCKNAIQKIRYILGLDYERICIDIIQKQGIATRISFFPSDSAIEKFYKACDAVVFPMTKPHQARPLFEAGAAKIPCVISNFENIAEFAYEENCNLFKPNNFNDLANVVNGIVSTPQEQESKVMRNYEDTIHRHDFRKYCVRIREEIDAVAEITRVP